MKTARVLDWDGTLMPLFAGGKTTLEQLLTDYAYEKSGTEFIGLVMRALFVKVYRQAARGFISLFGDPTWTGESSTLKVCDRAYLKPARIPTKFMYEKAREYASRLSNDVKSAIKNCEDDIYIVTAEPIQLIEKILGYAGLSKHVEKVYGIEFKIEKDIITGFDALKMRAGVSGKYVGICEIEKLGYDKIYALGDSAADVGLIGTKVIPCTFRKTTQALRDFVKKKSGKFVKNVEEFLALK
jgi:phosphoglycolate phosphatase-like HAD superfamily hydrolase